MSGNRIRRELTALFNEADLCDLDWLSSLNEFDEVPLFSRDSDIAFLLSEPVDSRGTAFMECVVAELDKVATVLNSLDHRAEYFLCLTFLDWELFLDGSYAVPTPSLFVSPRWRQELRMSGWIIPAVSRGARLIERWTKQLNRADLCIADALRDSSTDEPLRIYLGFRRGIHGFMSIGDLERSGRCISSS